MKDTARADDREPRGASAGSGALSAAPAAGRPPSAATLLFFCEDLARRQAEIDMLSRDGAAAEDIDAALDAWWATVEVITCSPATTFEAMQSKARALHMVMMAVGVDRSPEATALLASLLADLLGEAVAPP